MESSRYLSRWVLADPSLIALGILDDGRSWESVSNPLPAGEGAGCQGGIAGRPLARIYGVLLK